MSPKENEEKSEPKPAVNPAEDSAKTLKPDASKSGLKYVFKIAPADPKRNSIDFEDVADK
ncbi:MAG TPA: hypothetical protein VM509_02605 [Planctomycetota bacterium]|nr:hypothetical protein [Planctomycetota bacterium]